MELIVIIAYVLILIGFAGYCNGWMDWIKFKKLDSETWKSKWEKHPDFENFVENWYDWYYFGLYTPKYQERFMYSSTILVFLTDQWHFKKWCTFLCYEIALSSVIVYYERLPWWLVPIGIVVLKAIRGLGFTLKYDKKN